MSDLVKFDPSALANAVKDKIKLEILNVIPPEQWHQMIEGAVRSFTAPRQDTSYNGRGATIPSELEELVYGTIRDTCKASIKSVIEGPEFMSRWMPDQGKHAAAQVIEEIAVKAGPKIIKDMMTGLVSQVLMNMRAL